MFTLIAMIGVQNVKCAMKKSWKSAANFDAEIPVFTPFEKEAEMMMNTDEKIFNEIAIETTQTPTSPSPSAETLVGKISSKIRAPSNIVAAVYQKLHHDNKINEIRDFGKFEANIAAEPIAPEEPVAEPEPVSESEPIASTDSTLNASEILTENEEVPVVVVVDDESTKRPSFNLRDIFNQLSEEAEQKNKFSDEQPEAADDIELSTISNDQVNATQIKVGQFMNVTIDSEDSVVNVTLNQGTLKEIFKGSSQRQGNKVRLLGH